MTRPIDKLRIICSRDDVVAVVISAAVVLSLAAASGFFLFQGFGFVASLVLGGAAVCALGALLAVTAPIWGLGLSLFYILALIVLSPLYQLATQWRKIHKAS